MTKLDRTIAIIGLVVTGFGVLGSTLFGSYHVYGDVTSKAENAAWKNYVHERLNDLEDKIDPLEVKVVDTIIIKK